MSYKDVPAGARIPEEINVYIEIPANHLPIKYELDKVSGEIFVDRFLSTSMSYPANYGFIPNTLSEDGDPLDALVICPYPVSPGVVVRSRPIGVMYMEDEAGPDAKIVAVPVDKLSAMYRKVKSCDDLPEVQLAQISHFFNNYKSLEPGKWVRLDRWGTLIDAKSEIQKAVTAYKNLSVAHGDH